ncbi:YueI family protein [Enterococcus sp. AZ126]|uniref:YueI family protein n=1 Tax=Enterococcus sp. AZ126 TaxID=2774635 RepID=UPI003F29479D
MAQDDLQKHLDNAMYGTPLLKPEEQRKYMGTFRERCYLTMTIAQMKNAEDKANFLQELTQHPDATVLLNGTMATDLQSVYIKLINERQIKFTVMNDFVENTPDALGLVLTAKDAVNEAIIDVDKKYPKPVSATRPEQPKKGFWHKLFK